ncbi:MAG: hypothetical protein IKN90_04380, partial [Treponema sp.]|nr:hypothetical protein [Treponema sp.]
EAQPVLKTKPRENKNIDNILKICVLIIIPILQRKVHLVNEQKHLIQYIFKVANQARPASTSSDN